jgi:hypothetical protein
MAQFWTIHSQNTHKKMTPKNAQKIVKKYFIHPIFGQIRHSKKWPNLWHKKISTNKNVQKLLFFQANSLLLLVKFVTN